MNNESFEKKLYIARNAEGELNKEALDVIRELEQRPEDHPVFIGIAPKGSIVSNRSSDIDLTMILDSSKLEEPTDINEADIHREYERKGVNLFFVDINPEKVLINPEQIAPYDIDAFSELTKIVTGRKVDYYRQLFRERLRQLSPEKLEELRSLVSDELIKEDAYSLPKLTKRIPELTDKAHDIIETRRNLWLNRWDKIWG